MKTEEHLDEESYVGGIKLKRVGITGRKTGGTGTSGEEDVSDRQRTSNSNNSHSSKYVSKCPIQLTQHSLV